MSRKLKVTIATAGRFHVLYLARELHLLGHEVRFLSYVPKARAAKFGLPEECHVSLLPFALPALAWEYLAKQVAPQARERFLYAALNRAAIIKMKECDVFTCMSGIYLEAAVEAQRRFGAKIWMHRGSRHILSQDQILSTLPNSERPSSLAIQRELAGYSVAHRIVIPSDHVEESFRAYPEVHKKLYLNPYGVDVDMFPQRAEKRPSNPVTILFVGHWSLRKGCDLLAAAIPQVSGVRLLHVGKILDLPFPKDDENFSHIEPVPQWELKKFYESADAFVHASREEGLSTVLGQALASGLPIICTDHTGGANLAHTPALAERIDVIRQGDVAGLANALARLRDRVNREGWRPLSEFDRKTLSWTAYGSRYSDELARAFG